MRKDKLDALSIGLLIVLCASWGLQQVAIKLSAADIQPITQSALRSIGATLLVALWIKARRQPIFNKDGTLWWGIAAGTLFGLEFLLIYWGLEFTNASRAVIFLYTSPFIVALGMQLFVPDEKLTRNQVFGLILAFAGIIAAFGESLSLPDERMLIGDIMLLVAAVLWGATTVTIKAGPLTQIPASKTLLYQLGVSAIILPLIALSFEAGEPITFSPLALSSLAYQTIWIATLTYIAWFWMIRTYPAAKLTSFSFLTPLFGVIAGALILGDPLTPALLVAAALVAMGIYMVNKPARKLKTATN